MPGARLDRRQDSSARSMQPADSQLPTCVWRAVAHTLHPVRPSGARSDAVSGIGGHVPGTGSSLRHRGERTQIGITSRHNKHESESRQRKAVRERRRSAAVSLHDRPVGPATIPVIARLTAHRKSACWALRRLDGPTTNLRYQSRGLRSKRTDTADDQSRWCQLPQRLHTPTPRRPRRSALRESGKHGGVDVNFPAYSGRTQRHPIRFYAFAQVTGLRPKALGIAKTAPFQYPHQVYEEGLGTAFPQVRGPLAHVVAGEGFEPSKLSRWIYRPPTANP
jgi:hypothetical protein